MAPFTNNSPRGQRLENLRQLNEALVFYTIQQKGPVSRTELSELTRLTAATIGRIVKGLIQQGVVEEVGHSTSGLGRRRTQLRVSSSRGRIIAISLERLGIRGAITDLRASSFTKHDIEAEQASNPVAVDPSKLLDLVDSLVSDVHNQGQEVIGVGISAPGPLDSGRGILVSPPAFPGWRQIPIRDLVENRIGVATFLDNDANACALAEKWLGGGRGMSNFVYILADTGVGSGVVIDGDIYRGERGIAGEIGHTTVMLDGPKCECGNTGCLEIYASPLAATEMIRQKIAQGHSSLALQLAGGSAERIAFSDVAKAARQGDPVSVSALESMTSALACGIVNVIGSFDPEAVMLGGRICEAGDVVFDMLRANLSNRTRMGNDYTVPIFVGQLGRDAPLLGAFCLVLRELFSATGRQRRTGGEDLLSLPLHTEA